MNYENKFLIICITFILLCLVATLYLFTRSIENANKIIDLNNKKEVLEIENNQLNKIYESIK